MIYVCFLGERSRGGFEHWATWHRGDRDFVVRVKRGRGFLAERGDSVANGQNTETPFVSILEQVRDKCRCILSISEELPAIDYSGMAMVRLGDQVIDCADIKFSAANDIPVILTSQ